jgi:NADPH-dependent 2,4-dienoyl-CoA reductase/sulfur reductase-like enzyme
MGSIVVVGGGIAGDEAALAARKRAPGDRVVLVTEEPHPLYSACVLADYVCDGLPLGKVFLRGSEEYRALGIESLTETPVTGWSPEGRVLSTPKGEIAYDKLILATGSRSFIPPIPGAKNEGVVSLKTLDDAEKIRKAGGSSAVVVGSGPVGIESALALRERGWTVTIVELMERVLPRVFDAPIAEMAAERVRGEGVDLHLGEKVLEVLGDGKVEGVRTDRRTVTADLVVMVVGMRPEVTLAKAGGVKLGPMGGIEVDVTMATSVPGVWACGDCVETEDRITGKRAPYMLWNNARVQGRIAGTNAAGGSQKYAGSLNITTVSFDRQAGASVGYLAADLPPEEVKLVHRESHDGAVSLVLRGGRLVGAQVLGRTERIGVLMGHILTGGELKRSAREPGAKQLREAWELFRLRKELESPACAG